MDFFLAVPRKKEEGDGNGEGRKRGRQATMHLGHGALEEVLSGGGGHLMSRETLKMRLA